VANALRAPSAGFTQGTELLVLQGADQTSRYWDACFPAAERSGFRWPGVLRAPLLLVVFAGAEAYLDRYSEPDKGRIGGNRAVRDPSRWPAAYWDIDAAFASLLALLTAVDAGLGALFFAVARPDALRAEFGIPERFSPVGTVAVGFPLPDEPSSSLARGRRPQEEVVHRGQW
jgi:nitroreductase